MGSSGCRVLWGGGVGEGEVRDDSGEEEDADDGIDGEECFVDGAGVGC